MDETNKFGLTRHIPADIRRQVRQKCGFGCVVCGSAIIDYDHFDPEFSDAREHLAEGIILLCPMHHALKTRKQLSAETISRSLAHPAAIKMGFANAHIDIGSPKFSLVIGPTTFTRCLKILRIWGEDLIWIDPPEQNGAPLRLNARIPSSTSEPALEIIDNEWRSSTGNWDVETIGAVTTIRSRKGVVALKWETFPPNCFRIHQMSWQHRDVEVVVARGSKYIEVFGLTRGSMKLGMTLVDGIGGVALNFNDFSG